MSKNYNLVNIYGKTKELYSKIAPFAMDRRVVRELDGYPILADDNMAWFIAMDENKVIGFSAVKNHKDFSEFTYFYVIPEYRQQGVLKLLFNECMKYAKRNKIKIVKADCTDVCLKVFKKAKFKVIRKFQNWTKVEKEL